MSQYFPKPDEPFRGDLKNATRVDISKLAAKSDLFSLRAEVDKLDIDKLISAPVDLSKISDVVKNDVAKKTVSDKLVAKVNNIDTSGFVLKNKYNTHKSNLEKKLMILVDLLKSRL